MLLLLACAGASASPEATVPDRVVDTRLSGLSIRDDGGCVLNAGVPVCWGPALSRWGLPVSPTSIAALGVVDEVLLGESELCTLREDELRCWSVSDDLHGDPSRFEPNVSQVFLDREGGCFLRRGAVTCWAGDETREVAGSYVAIAGADRTACGIAPDSSVRCWRRASIFGDESEEEPSLEDEGSSDCGANERDGSTSHFAAPVRARLNGARALVVSDESICATRANGRVRCVGGVVPWSNREPTWEVPGVVADELQIGGEHVCARHGDRARCWGFNHFGQCATGNTLHGFTGELLLVCGHSYVGPPRESVAAVTLSNVRELALGPAQTCAITGDRVQCVGRNLHGAFGSLPVHRPGLFPVRGQRVFAGGTLVCADVDGEARCLIANPSDRPNFAYRPHEVPWSVAGLTGNGVTSCVLDDEQVLLCGYGTPHRGTVLHDVAEVAVGRFAVCARMIDGSVRCWSAPPSPEEFAGQPTPVDGVTDASTIGVGGDHACAIRDGRVWCWNDEVEELGVFTDAIELSLNEDSTCVRTASGVSCRRAGEDGFHMLPIDDVVQMAAWGSKRVLLTAAGEVIEDQTFERVAVHDIDQIEAGNQLFCAHDRRDRIWCWGVGAHGELGRRPEWVHVRPVIIELPAR